MNELHKQYVGYCSHGMFITEIKEIIQSSQIRTNAKSSDGKMHVDIVALVEGIIYEKDEIIPDAKIAKITDTIATATSKYASININIGKLNILKVGDVTPVLVRMVQYNKYTDKIAVAANIFMPATPPLCMLKCIGEYKEDAEILELKNRIEYCMSHIKKLPESNSKSLSYFNEMIYPVKKTMKWDNVKLIGINGGKADVALQKISVENLDKKIGNDVLLFMPDMRLAEDNIYIGTAFKSDKEIWKVDKRVVVVTDTNTLDAHKVVLIDLYRRLYTLLQLVETYPDKEALDKSSHIWKFYEMNKN